MSATRLYAAPLMLLMWACLVAFVSASTLIAVVRPVTVAFALAVSIRELSGLRRRRGR